MVDNHLYNLMNQLVEESRSLKRIKELYRSDAGDCEDCTKFWAEMVEDKEEHVEDLNELIKDHVA